jgi:hypothetical protein
LRPGRWLVFPISSQFLRLVRWLFVGPNGRCPWKVLASFPLAVFSFLFLVNTDGFLKATSGRCRSKQTAVDPVGEILTSIGGHDVWSAKRSIPEHRGKMVPQNFLSYHLEAFGLCPVNLKLCNYPG